MDLKDYLGLIRRIQVKYIESSDPVAEYIINIANLGRRNPIFPCMPTY